MISVALALYNGEKYILEQINSIVNQTVAPNEIVIVDDNSNDNSIKAIIDYIDDKNAGFDFSNDDELDCDKDIYIKRNLYLKSYNNDIDIIAIKIYKNNKNTGFLKTFITAIKKCKGDYIFLSDQDDVWLNDKIEKHMNVFNEKNANAVASNMLLVDEKLNKLENDNKGNNIEEVSFFASLTSKSFYGCLFSLKKNNDFDNLIHYMDNENIDVHDRFLTIYYAGIGKLYFIHTIKVLHRIHNNNVIGANTKLKPKGNNNIRISQSIIDYNLLKYYNDLVNNKKLMFNIENSNILNVNLEFRKSRIDILKNKNFFRTVSFVFTNYKFYRNLKTALADIYFSII